MSVNKVVFGNNTLIDLTNDTVESANDIAVGKYGHLKDGTRVLGTHSGGVTHASGTLTIGSSAVNTQAQKIPIDFKPDFVFIYKSSRPSGSFDVGTIAAYFNRNNPYSSDNDLATLRYGSNSGGTNRSTFVAKYDETNKQFYVNNTSYKYAQNSTYYWEAWQF